MRRILAAVLLALLLLAVVLVGNALRPFESSGVAGGALVAPAPALDAEATLDRFAASLRFATISFGDRSKLDEAAFAGFRDYLREAYPRVFERLDWEEVNSHSLLGRWPAPGGSSTPAMFLAHYDVVPVDPADAPKWSQPPFDGVRSEGFVWGRGALDDKMNLLAILEALDLLLAEGWEPRRDLYFAFGHDEEMGGREGAAKIAELLSARGAHFEYILDEGGAITLPGMMPGVDRPVAMIGVAEKGYLSLELSAHASGGHSSVPKPDSSILHLARALDALDRNPFPQSFDYLRWMAEAAAPELPFPARVLARNLWLFGPLLGPFLRSMPEIDALTRVTIAPTMLAAGIKDNVQPTEAHAIVNLRLLPGWSVESVRERVAGIVAEQGVEVRVLQGNEASPRASARDGPGWRTIEAAIQAAWGEDAARKEHLTVVPFLTLGGTDLAHYYTLTEQHYRFGFAAMAPQDFRRVHGIDERIAEAGYLDAVRFYYHALRGAGTGEETR